MKKVAKITPPTIEEVFSILSKKEARAIFDAAKSGVVAKIESANGLGLTLKQYYTRLGELKELYLIRKVGEIYVRTEFGNSIDKNIDSISSSLKEDQFLRFSMIDILRESGKYSEEELGVVASKV